MGTYNRCSSHEHVGTRTELEMPKAEDKGLKWIQGMQNTYHFKENQKTHTTLSAAIIFRHCLSDFARVDNNAINVLFLPNLRLIC